MYFLMSGNCSATVLYYAYYFQLLCGHPLSSDDTCIVIAVACFNLLPLDGVPACLSQRFTYEWTAQTSQKVCMTALSKLTTRFPWCPLGLLRLFLLPANTEHSLVRRRFSGMALGTSVA